MKPHPSRRGEDAAPQDEANAAKLEQKEIPMFEKGLLAGKRILVTGGGSGPGAAMGRRCVELGAELIICGRRLELLEATAARLRGRFAGKVNAPTGGVRDSQAV